SYAEQLLYPLRRTWIGSFFIARRAGTGHSKSSQTNQIIQWIPYARTFTARRPLQPATSRQPALPDQSTIETVPPPDRPASPARPASGNWPASRRAIKLSLPACRSDRKPVSRLRAIQH